MYFEVSLIPKDLIIEAENEDELQEILKKITIEKVWWSTHRLNKDRFKEELQSRYVYLKQ